MCVYVATPGVYNIYECPRGCGPGSGPKVQLWPCSAFARCPRSCGPGSSPKVQVRPLSAFSRCATTCCRGDGILAS